MRRFACGVVIRDVFPLPSLAGPSRGAAPLDDPPGAVPGKVSPAGCPRRDATGASAVDPTVEVNRVQPSLLSIWVCS